MEKHFRLKIAGLFFFAVQQTVRLVLDSIADYRAAEEAHQRLADVTDQRESFISRNSIELEKPIRNIVELGESLLKGSIGPLNSEQIATSSLIVSNGTRLTNMVNDILDFTNIKENAIELNLIPVALPKLLKKVLNSCESLVAVKEVELVSNLDKDMPPVSADERRFEQIFYNLISNSIRHTEKGRITVEGSSDGNMVEILILIEGSNLAAADVNALFNAYAQGKNTDVDQAAESV